MVFPGPLTGALVAASYLAFSVFAARIRCGHTYANFFNQATANAPVS